MSLGKHHLTTLAQIKRAASKSLEKSSDPNSRAGALLEMLGRSVRFDAAWLLLFDSASLNIRDIHLHRFDQKAFSTYLDFYYSRCPIPTIREMGRSGQVALRGSELPGGEGWTGHPFYQEVISPLGLKFFLAGALLNQERGPMGMVVLWRAKSRYDFSSRDRLFLEQSSVSSSAFLISPKDGLNSQGSLPLPASTAEADASVPAVLIMGSDDRVRFQNREAKDIMDIVKSGKASLYQTGEDDFLRSIRRLRDRMMKPSPAGDSPHSPNEIFLFRGTAYSMKGIPLEGDGGDPSLVMILVEAVKAAGSSGRAPRSKSDFTAREGTISGLITRGFTNKEIAAEMGIGIHTVKDHIKSIMKKLNTNTRSGIVGKLMVW